MKMLFLFLASFAAIFSHSASARMEGQGTTLPPASSHSEPDASPQKSSALDFSFEGIDGKPIDLRQFKGNAILIVNTASECGFTQQYAGLEKLWKEYHPRGLIVLAVPSNDFGAQEPDSNADIKKFCTNVYALDFPIAGKTVVKGTQAHPFYQFAARTLGAKTAPRWNFHKYLINADGSLVDWFSSATEPDDARLLRAIERALPAQPSAQNQPGGTGNIH